MSQKNWNIPLFLFTLLLSPHFLAVGTLHAGVDEGRTALANLAENVESHTLSNGVRVILYRRGIAPVFSGAVVLRVGGADEEIGNTGISHMLEHMAFKGTDTIGTRNFEREKVLLSKLEKVVGRLDAGDKDEQLQTQLEEIHSELADIWISDGFTREYEKRGATGLNATTGKDLTRYFVSLPRTSFEFWAWIESERILNPVMRQFYQERDVVLEERRMRYENDPGGKLYELLLGTVYQSHPYRNPVIGYEHDLRRLTATQVDEFRKKYYVPGNIVVSVVGDIDPETDLQTLEKYFGRLPPGEMPPRPTMSEALQEGERIVHIEAAASPRLSLAYRKPNYPHPDDAAISVMLEVLAGGRTSPLYEELVRKRQVAAGVSHSEGPGQAYENLIFFSISPRSPHTNDEVLQAFDEVITEFKETSITSEQIERAKRSIAMSYLNSLRSSMSLALQFASLEILYDDWQVLSKWYEEVMATTADDLTRVANEYLNSSSRTVGRVETKID